MCIYTVKKQQQKKFLKDNSTERPKIRRLRRKGPSDNYFQKYFKNAKKKYFFFSIFLIISKIIFT